MVSRPLSQWLGLLTALIVLVFGFMSFFLVDNFLATMATDLVNAQAQSLMDTMLAVRKYTSERTNPIIQSINLQDSRHFLAESVPSYAAKSVFANMKKSAQFRDYVYREAVVNPTNEEDLPSEIESVIIKKFQANHNLKEDVGFVKTDLVSYHYIARPLIVNSPLCLRCHSVPENAPKSMIDRYGNKNGFGWKVNDIIGAQIVKVPLGQIFAQKQRLQRNIVILVIAVMSALAAALILLLQFLIVRPLAVVTGLADQASLSPADVAFPPPGRLQELNRLHRSLDRLRVSLLVAMNLAKKP